MERESVRVTCAKCGVVGKADPNPSSWQCANCHKGFFVRRCAACARVSFVDALHEFKRDRPCGWCGQSNTGLAAASVGELAAEKAKHDSLTGELDLSALPADAPEPAPPEPVASGAGSPRRRRRRLALPATLLTATLAACAAAVALLVPGGGNAGAKPTAAAPASTASATTAASSAPADPVTGLPRATPSATASTAAPASPAMPTPAASMANVAEVAQAVHVTAPATSAVDFFGAPGQLTVIGTQSSQVVLTGQLTGAAGTLHVTTSHAPNGTLVLTVTCASTVAVNGSCNGVLQLAVPAQTALWFSQPGGSVKVSGLSGPLSFTGHGTDVTATGLTSPSLTAALTTGQLDATFTVPPSQVTVTLTSSTATLSLPASVPYRVINNGPPSSVNATVAQSATANHVVTANINSGELALQPS